VFYLLCYCNLQPHLESPACRSCWASLFPHPCVLDWQSHNPTWQDPPGTVILHLYCIHCECFVTTSEMLVFTCATFHCSCFCVRTCSRPSPIIVWTLTAPSLHLPLHWPRLCSYQAAIRYVEFLATTPPPLFISFQYVLRLIGRSANPTTNYSYGSLRSKWTIDGWCGVGLIQRVSTKGWYKG